MQGEASTRLGFTDYYRVELAWATLLGTVLLLAPVPARLKEWAYAAFAITLGSALEDEQRVANQDAKNPAQMKASAGSPLTDVSADYRFHVDDGRSVRSFEMSHLQSPTVDCVMTMSCRRGRAPGSAFTLA